MKSQIEKEDSRDVTASLSIVSAPLRGSLNIVVPSKFQEKTRWVFQRRSKLDVNLQNDRFGVRSLGIHFRAIQTEIYTFLKVWFSNELASAKRAHEFLLVRTLLKHAKRNSVISRKCGTQAAPPGINKSRFSKQLDPHSCR